MKLPIFFTETSTGALPYRIASMTFMLAPLCLATLLVLLPVIAHAEEAATQQQAVQVAMQRAGGNGKVLSVETKTGSDGSVIFAVKVLSNGRVRVFRIPKSR